MGNTYRPSVLMKIKVVVGIIMMGFCQCSLHYHNLAGELPGEMAGKWYSLGVWLPTTADQSRYDEKDCFLHEKPNSQPKIILTLYRRTDRDVASGRSSP